MLSSSISSHSPYSASFCAILGKGVADLADLADFGTELSRPTERTAPMRGTVASVDVVYCCLDLGSRKVGRTVAADTLTDSVVERKAGIVQDRGQLYKIGMTVTGNKSIALFILVNVVRKPRAGAHASGGMSGSRPEAPGQQRGFRSLQILPYKKRSDHGRRNSHGSDLFH